jgi:hypothetical protein
MPFPLLALKGATMAKSALGLAAGAEAARTATSKLAMFAHEMDESTKTLARMASGHAESGPLPPGAQAQPPVTENDGEPVVEHPDLVWKHRKTPEWFVRKLVKVRFDVSEGTEYIWVQVLAVAPGRKGRMVGRLANAPELLEGHIGDVVSFPVGSILDVQTTMRKRSRRRR